MKSTSCKIGSRRLKKLTLLPASEVQGNYIFFYLVLKYQFMKIIRKTIIILRKGRRLGESKENKSLISYKVMGLVRIDRIRDMKAN